eukprot:8603526-Ditylum_brightwellii.AAC.1
MHCALHCAISLDGGECSPLLVCTADIQSIPNGGAFISHVPECTGSTFLAHSVRNCSHNSLVETIKIAPPIVALSTAIAGCSFWKYPKDVESSYIDSGKDGASRGQDAQHLRVVCLHQIWRKGSFTDISK